MNRLIEAESGITPSDRALLDDESMQIWAGDVVRGATKFTDVEELAEEGEEPQELVAFANGRYKVFDRYASSDLQLEQIGQFIDEATERADDFLDKNTDAYDRQVGLFAKELIGRLKPHADAKTAIKADLDRADMEIEAEQLIRTLKRDDRIAAAYHDDLAMDNELHNIKERAINEILIPPENVIDLDSVEQ